MQKEKNWEFGHNINIIKLFREYCKIKYKTYKQYTLYIWHLEIILKDYIVLPILNDIKTSYFKDNKKTHINSIFTDHPVQNDNI